MKRILNCAIILALCLTILPEFTFAQDTAQSYTQEQMESIIEKYESNEGMFNALFCSDTAIGYLGMVNDIKQNITLTKAIDISSMLIDEYPEEQDYAGILANLITMQSGELTEQIEMQSRFDDLKDTEDYVWNVVDVATTLLGGNSILEEIEPLIETVTEEAELVIDNIEQAQRRGCL